MQIDLIAHWKDDEKAAFWFVKTTPSSVLQNNHSQSFPVSFFDKLAGCDWLIGLQIKI